MLIFKSQPNWQWSTYKTHQKSKYRTLTPVNYYTPSYYSFDPASIYEKIPQYSFEVQVWVVQHVRLSVTLCFVVSTNHFYQFLLLLVALKILLFVLELSLNNDSFNTKTCNVRSTGSWLYITSLSLSLCNKGDWNTTSSLRPSTPL